VNNLVSRFCYEQCKTINRMSPVEFLKAFVFVNDALINLLLTVSFGSAMRSYVFYSMLFNEIRGVLYNILTTGGVNASISDI
jgi:hypothetical protein